MDKTKKRCVVTTAHPQHAQALVVHDITTYMYVRESAGANVVAQAHKRRDILAAVEA